MPNNPTIIIAGAGFGGVRAALDLSKYLPHAQIVLINNSAYHCIHSDLYEVAAAVLQSEKKIDFKDLSGTVNIPLKEIFKGKNVEIVIDSVTQVDLPQGVVTIHSGKEYAYDYLVLGFGSSTNYFGIKGAQDFSHPLKNTEDALNIRNDLDELMNRLDRPVHVMIAGGGFTGVELAGELTSFFKKMAKRHKRKVGHITIVEGSPSVLGGMPVWAQQKTLQRLQKLDVEVLTNKLISRVEEGKVICKDGEELAYDYLIWTTGIRGENINNAIKGVEFNKKGQIATLQDLSLEKYPNVFVLGDLAECMDLVRGCPVSSTAWAAISQGKVVAKNILHKIKGEPTEHYISPKPVFVVPVGSYYALSNYKDLQIEGVLGWKLKKLVTLKYLLSLFPANKAINLWWRGVRIFSNND